LDFQDLDFGFLGLGFEFRIWIWFVTSLGFGYCDVGFKLVFVGIGFLVLGLLDSVGFVWISYR
jgi:hypothetical protein